MGNSVLIVEDDAGLRDVIGAVLGEDGYAVATAADGLEALERLGTGSAGLLVLDWAMPRLDAPGLVEELRRRGLRPGLPVLLLTAASGPDEKAARIGAEGCLAKPFDVEDLLAEVERLLRVPEPERQPGGRPAVADGRIRDER